MQANKHIVSKLLIFLLLYVCVKEVTIAQTVLGPQTILKSFSLELAQAKQEDRDTLVVYAKYMDQLVDRGNFIQVDSILSPISRELSLLEINSTLSQIYISRAYMYKVQRRYPKALEDYLLLIAHFENTNEFPNLAKTYCLLAEYYRAIGNYDLCKKHLNDAQRLFDGLDPDPELLAYWFSRKAAWANESLGNRDSVLYYAKEGLRILEPTDNVHTRALMLNEIGFSIMNIGLSQDSVLSYFDQSKDLLFENQRYRDYVEVVNNMGMYHYRFGDWQKAIQLLESILKIQEENKWFGSLEVTYDYLTGLYRDTGLTEQFHDAREKALLTTISNIQTINDIRVNDIAWDYETDLAQKELEVQEQRTETAESEAESNKRAFIIAAIIALFLLVVSILIYQVNIRFRRKNTLLNEQQIKIQRTNIDLEKSLDQQRILFKELNHRVKNNLSILTGLIYLQEVGESDDNFKKTLGTLRTRIKSMALAHESLYNSEEAERIEFQGYLRELFLELRAALSDANKIETRIECQGFQLGLQQAVPLAMIINELFTNSVKHGFKGISNGLITVKAYHERDYSIVEYTDNGIGFSLEQKEKRTLGLRLVNLLLEQLNATFDDKSKDSGVHFVLKIPTGETN